MIDSAFELCFDIDLLEILTPEEIMCVSLFLLDVTDLSEWEERNYHKVFFCETQAYHKLFEYYLDEMPYGVAKCRTGEPDTWILNKLIERLATPPLYRTSPL